MGYMIDNVITARIIYLFVTPFEKWDAFKYGIIDKDGKILRKAGTLTKAVEKDSWSMLHRLVNRLKRMLATIPTGKSMLTSIAAAYMLIREGVTDDTPELEELFASCYNSLMINESVNDELQNVMKMAEEAGIANTTANIPPGPVIKIKRNVPKLLRKKFKKTPSVNECVIVVNRDEYWLM